MKLMIPSLGFKLFKFDLFTAILGAAISLILARLWGPEIQGSWSILNNFTSTCAMLISAGVPSVILSLIRRNELQEGKIWNQSMIYVLITGMVLSLITYVIVQTTDVAYLISEFVYSIGGYLLASIQVSLMVSINILGAWMDGKNKLLELSRLRLFLTLVLGLAILIFYILFSKDTATFMYAVWYGFIAQALVLVALIIYTLPAHTIHSNKIPIGQSITSIIAQSGWIYVVSEFFQKLNYKADIWFLAAYKSNEQVGVYSIASTLSLFLLLRPRNSQRTLINSFHKEDSAHNHTLIRTEVSNLTKEVLLIAIVFLALAFVLFRYFLGSAYQGGFRLLAFLIIGIVLISITMPYSAYFVYVNRPKYNACAALLGFVINVFCNWLWIPTYGTWGAAWASLCTYGITAFSLYCFYQNSKRNNFINETYR